MMRPCTRHKSEQLQHSTGAHSDWTNVARSAETCIIGITRPSSHKATRIAVRCSESTAEAREDPTILVGVKKPHSAVC